MRLETSSCPARVALAVLGLAATLSLLSGCGSATSSSAGTQTAAASVPDRASSSTSSSTPATTTVSQSAPHSGPPTCRAAALKPSFLGMQGATGHGELGFAVRNSSGTSCDTFGYPGVQFLSQSGALLPTVTHRATSDLFGHSPLATVHLAPGDTASFRLAVTHGIGSSAGCTSAYGLQVYSPKDTATLRVMIPGGATECGTATVSPLQPGTSAYR
ncbi:MAG: DUF4232 domain-containing protein [Solirubrobacteraceae bacterium]